MLVRFPFPVSWPALRTYIHTRPGHCPWRVPLKTEASVTSWMGHLRCPLRSLAPTREMNGALANSRVSLDESRATNDRGRPGGSHHIGRDSGLISHLAQEVGAGIRDSRASAIYYNVLDANIKGLLLTIRTFPSSR